jgi:hypothetical protein
MARFSRSFRIFLVCLLAAFALIWYEATSGGAGGQYAESPDGRYRLDVSTRFDPKPGDWYTAELTDRSSDAILRRVQFKLSTEEKPRPLRGGPRVIQWSPNSDFADIIGPTQKPCIRIYVP